MWCGRPGLVWRRTTVGEYHHNCVVVHYPVPAWYAVSLAQPWSGDYTTNNYVKYQRYRAGEPNRTNPLMPNMCLVVAKGLTYSSLTLGLGTVHPNCRVSHFGFFNNDAMEGWTDTEWVDYNETNPDTNDQAINLNYLFPQLDPGASLKFTWAYILNLDDLATAMTVVSSVVIIQPTTTVSGASSVFSASVSTPVSSVLFTISNASTVRLLVTVIAVECVVCACNLMACMPCKRRGALSRCAPLSAVGTDGRARDGIRGDRT